MLDQAAIERYSQIYYHSPDPHGAYPLGGGYGQERVRDLLGVKVIKPNGREFEMGPENIIEDDKGRKKIAVANLEVGDILDYYIFTFDYVGRSYNPYIFALIKKLSLRGPYPIQDYQFRLITGPNWKVGIGMDENDPVEIVERKTEHRDYEFFIQKHACLPKNMNFSLKKHACLVKNMNF